MSSLKRKEVEKTETKLYTQKELEHMWFDELGDTFKKNCLSLESSVEEFKKELGEELCTKIDWWDMTSACVITGQDGHVGSAVYIAVGEVIGAAYHFLIFDPFLNTIALDSPEGALTSSDKTDIKKIKKWLKNK